MIIVQVWFAKIVTSLLPQPSVLANRSNYFWFSQVSGAMIIVYFFLVLLKFSDQTVRSAGKLSK